MVKLTCGVERGPSKSSARPPRVVQMDAASSAKWREKWRTSWPMTMVGTAPGVPASAFAV